LRWYRPSPDAGLPVTVYFHGGGWSVDNPDTHDHLCRLLASRSQAIVVSVACKRGSDAAPFCESSELNEYSQSTYIYIN